MRSIPTQASEEGPKSRTIAVIGGGIYGIYTSLALADVGFTVTLYERNASLFSGTSGSHAIRLHAGPHYPRSPATRAACRTSLRQFTNEFPHLVALPSVSLYAVGECDADGAPSRTNVSDFDAVCRECNGYQRVSDPASFGISAVRGIWSVDEPVLYQDSMRRELVHRVKTHPRICLQLNHTVRDLTHIGQRHVAVDGMVFDWVVNCTFFKSFSSDTVSGAPVVYQPCVALYYDDRESGPNGNAKPFTFTVMDGWFPNLMPLMYKHARKDAQQRYILYHAKYALLGSYDNYEECSRHAMSVTEDWVMREVRPRMEDHMQQLMPKFRERFQYAGFHVDTVTKLRSQSEFRASIVWQNGRVIHELSGKVHECIEAATRVVSIISEGDDMVRGGECQIDVERDAVAEKTMGELTQTWTDVDGACDLGVHCWQ